MNFLFEGQNDMCLGRRVMLNLGVLNRDRKCAVCDEGFYMSKVSHLLIDQAFSTVVMLLVISPTFVNLSLVPYRTIKDFEIISLRFCDLSLIV